MENKNSQRAKKAWETMRKRGYIKKKDKKSTVSYDRPIKNSVREEIIKLINKLANKNFEEKENQYGEEEETKKLLPLKILTLETEKYLLASKLKKHQFFISEYDKKRYWNMLDSKPKNVFLHFGNISDLCDITEKMDVIYLDFCGGFEREKYSILKLINKIDRAKLIGFTFCTRRNKKDLEDYKFDLINKVQTLLKRNLKVIYGKAYRDKNEPPMITLFFENIPEIPEFDYRSTKNRELFGEKLCKKAIKKIEKEFPWVWSPSQVFDPSAKTYHIKWNKFIIPHIFNLLLKENEILLPFNNSELTEYKNSYYYDLDGLYNFFVNIMVRNIWRLWKKYLIIKKYKEPWSKNEKPYIREEKVHFQNNHYFCEGYSILNCEHPYIEKYIAKSQEQVDFCCGEKCVGTKDKAGIFILDGKNYCNSCFLKKIKEKENGDKN